MDTKTSASALTYAGALPFLAAAVVLIIEPNAFYADIEPVLGTYSALIVSFLAGIHWHIGLSQKPAPGHLIWISNAFVLTAWGGVFVQPDPVAWALFAVLFAGLLYIDRGLFQLDLHARWFYRLRLRISTVVISSLLIITVATLSR